MEISELYKLNKDMLIKIILETNKIENFSTKQLKDLQQIIPEELQKRLKKQFEEKQEFQKITHAHLDIWKTLTYVKTEMKNDKKHHTLSFKNGSMSYFITLKKFHVNIGSLSDDFVGYFNENLIKDKPKMKRFLDWLEEIMT